MRLPLSGLLVVAVVTFAGFEAKGESLITATHRVPEPVGGTFAVPFGRSGAEDPPAIRVAQTFTAETGGLLQSASMTVASLNADPTGLQLAVMALENGQPGTVLAIAPMQGLYVNGLFSDIKALNAVAVFDDSPVVLQQHDQYALVFVTDRHPINFQALGAQTIGMASQYAGGELLRSLNGEPYLTVTTGDLVFAVNVRAIPEPAALTLGLIGAAVGWRRGRGR